MPKLPLRKFDMKLLLSRRALILVFLFATAFSLRIGFLSKGPFHIDAIDLALCSQETLRTLRIHYEHGTGYPLTVLLGSFSILFFKIFGVTDPVFCVNVMSAFFGALGVALMFLFVERLFDERRALVTASLMAFFAPHVAISTFGKSLTLSICFALAACYFALRYGFEGRRLYLVAAAFFLGFCAASRLSDALIIIPMVFLVWLRPGRAGEKLRAAVVLAAIGFMTAALYYVPFLCEKGLAPLVRVITQKNEAAFLGFFSPVFKFSFLWLLSVLDLPGVLVVLCGIGFLLIHRRLRHLFFLALWFLVFQFFYGNVSSSGVRYLVIGWLPLLVLQGYFLGMFKGRLFWASSLLLVVLAVGPLLQAAPALEFRHRRALQVEYAQWVASKISPQDLVVAVDEGIFIQVYGGRDVLHQDAGCDEAKLDAFFTKGIDGALAEGRRVVMVGSAFAYDPCFMFEKRIKKDYDRVYLGSRLNEDWHHVLLNQRLFQEGLWEIRKKP
jgi:energy-converting hydrogenase Eha subunit A